MQPTLEERIQDRLIREEREDSAHAYSPRMSRSEIEAFLARLHEQDAAWDKEQLVPTHSVPIIQEIRAERTKQLVRRGRNAHRD